MSIESIKKRWPFRSGSGATTDELRHAVEPREDDGYLGLPLFRPVALSLLASLDTANADIAALLKVAEAAKKHIDAAASSSGALVVMRTAAELSYALDALEASS